MRKLIDSCARLAETTNALQDLSRAKDRQYIEQYKNVNADLVSQVGRWEVAAHIFTAVVCVGLGAAAHQYKMGDVTSAVTIGSKTGETISTWLRSGETELQGRQRIIDHKLNKGDDKQISEVFQQHIRLVQDIQQQVQRARGG